MKNIPKQVALSAAKPPIAPPMMALRFVVLFEGLVPTSLGRGAMPGVTIAVVVTPVALE
jgi:hypothetical protein